MALNYEDFWNKSKTLIERALEKRNDQLFEEFQFWAAIALELLGKAALAKIHPTLIVNPEKFDHLLIACGHIVSTDYRTITARTLFERCRRVVTDFDKVAEDFCVLLANRRNSDLHSGEVPFAGISIDSWQPKYWQITKLFLTCQDRTLADFVGPAEAEAAEAIISDASTALSRAVEGRIRKHRQIFEETHPADSQEQVRKHALIAVSARLTKAQQTSMCPACNSPGILTGEFQLDEQVGPDEEEPWLMQVRRFYGSELFECIVCGLKLTGINEIAATNIPVEFEKIEFEEIDYEPEYGND
jgi:hypothetical protein